MRLCLRSSSICRRRRTRRKSTQKRRSKSSRPTIGNFSSSRTADGGCATAFLLSRRLFSPQEPCLRWLPVTIRSTMQRCGVRKHSAFTMMILLRQKMEKSFIIQMVHMMTVQTCPTMTIPPILRCPKMILLPQQIQRKHKRQSNKVKHFLNMQIYPIPIHLI